MNRRPKRVMQSLIVCLNLGFAATTTALDAAAQPAGCERVSGRNTVALLELYSSEGCDSCPPADRFVSEIVARGLGPERVVPLALHVDYWDTLGWKDRFASAEYTQRQYWLSEKNTGKRSAYTPELFLGGREWRGWGGADLVHTLDSINSRPAQAEISLRVHQTRAAVGNSAGNSLAITAAATAAASIESALKAEDLKLFIALAENGLTSSVEAGENRGVTLHHDAVVRQLAGPFSKTAVVEFKVQADSPGIARAGARRLSVVGFVQNVRSGEVLQALSIPLPCAS